MRSPASRSIALATLLCLTGAAFSATESPSVTPVPPTPPAAQPAAEETPVLKAVSRSSHGSLDLEALIQRALDHSPRLLRYRGEVTRQRAKQAAAWDLRDPELRFAWGSSEDEIAQPYTDTRTSTTQSSGTETTGLVDSQTAGSYLPDGTITYGATTTTGETRQTTTQGRKEVVQERRVIPGQTSDREIVTTYEVDRSRQSEHRNNSDLRLRDINSDTTRRVISRTESVRTHADAANREDSFEIQLRFFLPNPFVAIAKKKSAIAAQTLAERQMDVEAWQIELAVRRSYEKLQFQKSLHIYNQQLSTQAEAFEALLKQNEQEVFLVDPRLLPEAGRDATKSLVEVTDSQRELDSAFEDLAELTYLDSPDQVKLSNKLALRQVTIRQADLEPLAQLALASRADLAELDSRVKVAETDLSRLKAERWPFTSYIQGWFGTTDTQTQRKSEDYGVQIGLSLPLASFLFNKEHKVVEAELQSIKEPIIRNQVAFAIRQLTAATKALSDTEGVIRAWEEKAARYMEYARQVKDQKDKRYLDIQQSTEAETLKVQRNKMQAVSHYNEAVRLLEAALGLPLEQAFSRMKSGEAKK
jgi:outer membrane protein TolC